MTTNSLNHRRSNLLHWSVCCLFFTVFYPAKDVNGQSTFLKIHAGIEQIPRSKLQTTVFITANPNAYKNKNTSTNATAIVSVALAYELPNKSFFEIGFSRQKRDNQIFLFDTTTIGNTAVYGKVSYRVMEGRVEYAVPLSTKPFYKRLYPYCGFFMSGASDGFTYTPTDTTGGNFRLLEQNVSIGLGFSPRVIIKFGKRFSFDLNTAFFLLSGGLEHTYLNNPLFTEEQKTSDVFEFKFGNGYQVRLGLCYRIFQGKKNAEGILK